MFFGKRFSGYHGSSLSGLEILVLSLIKNHPKKTGYEITQEINKKFKPMWKASPGTIYPLLDRLLERNLLQVKKIVDDNNRKKKLYTITDKGAEALKEALKGHFKPSIDTLGKFIRTILQGINLDERMEEMFSCFPFRDYSHEEDIDENDLSRENIERIKKRISSLKRRKRQLTLQKTKVNNAVKHYEKVLENIEQKREKEAKPIPIVDDDEEFENF
jgi:DNA-binding PadR family transcriptional regulator